MSWIAVVPFFLLGFVCATRILSTEGTSQNNIEQFPFFGAVESNGQYACAATIIDDSFVLISNSCISAFDVNSLNVRVGTDRLGHRGEFIKVLSVTPYYSFGGFETADIAMVKTAVPFTYDRKVMWLNPSANDVQEMQPGVLVGWASKTAGSPLVSIPVTVMPSAECSQIYANILNITNTMYCVVSADDSSQPCLADLGSPLYSNEQFFGMVTHNPGCGDSSLPVVITDISSYTGFIISVFCDLSSFF